MQTIKWSLFGLPWNGRGKIAVVGIAYDSSSELAKGSLAFPVAVRINSYGVEWEEEESVHELPAVDFGDLLPSPSPEKMVEEVYSALDELYSLGFRRFLLLGGNHSITIPAVKFLAEKGKIKRYVQFDAHADARDFWESRYSFACTFRRVCEILGKENCTLVGVRSTALEERDFLKDAEVIYAKEMNVERVRKEVRKADYVSIDMDVFSFANVTNPEPAYALELGDVLETLQGKKTAVDIVEGVPERIMGDRTATAAALIARKALFTLALDTL